MTNMMRNIIDTVSGKKRRDHLEALAKSANPEDRKLAALKSVHLSDPVLKDLMNDDDLLVRWVLVNHGPDRVVIAMLQDDDPRIALRARRILKRQTTWSRGPFGLG